MGHGDPDPHRGPGALCWPGQVRHGGGADADYPVSPMQSAFFFSRSETIWGGTAEVQRNIVGERVLGLPKEPKQGGYGHQGLTATPAPRWSCRQWPGAVAPEGSMRAGTRAQ